MLTESPPGHVYCGRWVVTVPEHPELQGSMRRSLSGSRATGLHQPDLLWLRRRGQEGLVRPLAFLPGLRHQPAPRPQRRQEYRKAWAEPSGSRGVGCGGEPSIPRLQPWGVSIIEPVVLLIGEERAEVAVEAREKLVHGRDLALRDGGGVALSSGRKCNRKVGGWVGGAGGIRGERKVRMRENSRLFERERSRIRLCLIREGYDEEGTPLTRRAARHHHPRRAPAGEYHDACGEIV